MTPRQGKKGRRTLKKAPVDPDPTNPYLIFVCLAKSSTEEMGDSTRSMVRKAAKLAVYEEMMIIVKNHQMPATMRVEVALNIQPNATSSYTVKRRAYDLLWSQIATLLHQRTDGEPGAVEEVEGVFQFLWIRIARVRVDPLERR